jgi:hypothetical protein
MYWCERAYVLESAAHCVPVETYVQLVPEEHVSVDTYLHVHSTVVRQLHASVVSAISPCKCDEFYALVRRNCWHTRKKLRNCTH